MKHFRSCFLLLLILALCLFLTPLSAAEGSLSISAPDQTQIGEAIPVTVSGLTTGEEIFLCLLDSQGRYLWGRGEIVEDESLQYHLDSTQRDDQLSRIGVD